MEAYDAAGRKQGPLLLEVRERPCRARGRRSRRSTHTACLAPCAQDILEPKRKQTTLSRRVYQFFTTMDGMEMIE